MSLIGFSTEVVKLMLGVLMLLNEIQFNDNNNNNNNNNNLAYFLKH
jgi:hypothetical protein